LSLPLSLSPVFAAISALLVCSVATVGLAQQTAHPPKAAQRREVRIPIRDFSLTDQNGREFKFQSVKNKAILVAFAYTTCPDVCPLVTAAMRQVQQELSAPERAAVYLITVTTDPEVDEPKVLASYAKRYGIDPSNWSLLTGKEHSLGEVWKNFGVKVHRKARGLIDHTPLTAVVDSARTMRIAYLGTAPDPKLVLKDIRAVLVGRKPSD